MKRETIMIVTPTAPRAVRRAQPAPRQYATVTGKRIGLLDNNKPNADRFLECVGALLKDRYEGVELIPKRKMTRTGADGLEAFAGRCDAVINALAD